MNKVIWHGNSNPLLYIYPFIGLAIAACGLYFFHPYLPALSVGAAFTLFRDALSTKYELTEDKVYFSASIFDDTPSTVYLKDIVGFMIIDKAPWSFFSLGSVLLITDISKDLQPCIKCIKNPFQLEKLIHELAIKQGAKIEYSYS